MAPTGKQLRDERSVHVVGESLLLTHESRVVKRSSKALYPSLHVTQKQFPDLPSTPPAPEKKWQPVAVDQPVCQPQRRRREASLSLQV